jgi:hypothetical protein
MAMLRDQTLGSQTTQKPEESGIDLGVPAYRAGTRRMHPAKRPEII